VIIDKKGYVKIVDRSKDLIKSGGEWISSVDLENALMSHNEVKEAAVIAYPHPVWQERPIAFIVIKEEEHLTEDELKEFLSQNLQSGGFLIIIFLLMKYLGLQRESS